MYMTYAHVLSVMDEKMCLQLFKDARLAAHLQKARDHRSCKYYIAAKSPERLNYRPPIVATIMHLAVHYSWEAQEGTSAIYTV